MGGAEKTEAAASVVWGPTGGVDRDKAAAPRFVGETCAAAGDESWCSMELDLEIDQCDKTLFIMRVIGAQKSARRPHSYTGHTLADAHELPPPPCYQPLRPTVPTVGQAGVTAANWQPSAVDGDACTR